MRVRAPFLLLALPLLGIARLLPASGFGLWLRLAAATLVVLLPGRLLARALGLRGAAAELSWSTALVAAALALTFAVQGSLDLALAVVLAAGAVALGASLVLRRGEAEGLRGRGLVALAGLAFGGAIWFVAGPPNGDAVFHLGRIRKLVDLDSLSLHAVGEFAHGGLHPGYAFPLWHGWLALVARVAGVDPTAVVVHESSLLVPLALLLALEMGIAVFRSAWLGLAVLLAQAATIALAPGSGGAYVALVQPGTAARQLFVPAATALFFLFVRAPTRSLGLTLAAAVVDLSFVHPTYALFLAIALAGFVGGRAVLARTTDLREDVGALAVYAIPMGLVYLWLRPIVDQTLAVNPGRSELERGLRAYAGDLVVHSQTSYHVDPAMVARTGSVAVAALALVPLALLARDRRWAAYVLGGAVLVLVIELSPLVFPHFADAVSLSQARRAAGFVPFAFAFAGGADLLVRLVSPLPAWIVALGAGIVLQRGYPGDFGVRTPHAAPGIVAWVALVGGAAALVFGALLAWRDPPSREPRPLHGPAAAAAAFLFVLPVAVHGFGSWEPRGAADPYALSPGLVRFLQHEVPERSVVFADLETSYRISGFAPVYVVAGPPAHVANTRANRVRARRIAVLRFLAHPDLAIPRRWGADWLVLRRDEPVRTIEGEGLRPAYADARFVAFHLGRPGASGARTG